MTPYCLDILEAFCGSGSKRQHARLIADVMAHDAGDEAPEQYESEWDGYAKPDIELPETPKEGSD